MCKKFWTTLLSPDRFQLFRNLWALWAPKDIRQPHAKTLSTKSGFKCKRRSSSVASRRGWYYPTPPPKNPKTQKMSVFTAAEHEPCSNYIIWQMDLQAMTLPAQEQRIQTLFFNCRHTGTISSQSVLQGCSIGFLQSSNQLVKKTNTWVSLDKILAWHDICPNHFVCYFSWTWGFTNRSTRCGGRQWQLFVPWKNRLQAKPIARSFHFCWWS